MKKICITFLSICILLLVGIGAYLNLDVEKTAKTEYLRIHIRANSNLENDQSVKLLVKDVVVDYLTPYIARIDTTAEAYDLLQSKLSEIEKITDYTLKQNGFNYFSKAKLTEEKFPTRTYQNLTLQSGYYDALIIELGEAKGDNWWCVVYPPLCFVGEGQNYVYKSKIQEIINGFFQKKQG